MSKLPVAAQVYSVRDEAEKDFVSTMKEIKTMGYDGVELAGLYGHSPQNIRDWLGDIGLVPISAHVPYDQLRDNLEETVANYALIGCKYIAVPYMGEQDRYGTANYDEFLKRIPVIAKECQRYGITLLYHNHDFEFVKSPEGTYILDDMYGQFQDDILQTEFDTGWIQAAGEDPIAYIHKYANRCPLVHVKNHNGKVPMETTPLDDGVLDIEGILNASLECGAGWVIVEQDDHLTNPPMDDMKQSIVYLKKLGW